MFFGAFGLYPLIWAARVSFTNWQGAGAFHSVGWSNYTFLLTDTVFWDAIGRSGVLWLMVVPIATIGALILALSLSRVELKARSFFRTSFMVPFVTPVVAMAEVWIVLFDQHAGAVNAILGFFGLPDIAWLTSTFWAKPTIAMLILWKSMGLGILIMLAGLQALDPQLGDAAKVDGASAWNEFWRVTVPMMRRSLAFFVVIETYAIFQLFAEPYLVEGPPPAAILTARRSQPACTCSTTSPTRSWDWGQRTRSFL